MSKARLELVLPTVEYESQVMSCRAEMLESGDGFDGCAGLEKVGSYGEWLNFEERKKDVRGKLCPLGGVPCGSENRRRGGGNY